MTKNLKLAPIFRDHMVIQHGVPVHIFGEGCGEIMVSLGANSKTVQADGKWLVTLEPMPAGGPHMLRVTCGGDAITVIDVMVGEVILCSGQSNMQFHMWDEVTPASDYADDGGLRIFVSGRMEQGEVILPQDGWVCAAKDNIRNWSALAYLVGRDLRRKKGCPVGVIACSQGASNIQTWIDERRYLGSALELPIEKMHPDARSPQYGVWNKPGLLYHYMLEPLLPYSVGNVLWYQGESNTSDAEAAIYMDLLRMMIENWREDFRNAALPFCVVQLADYRDTAAWRGVQDAQMRAQAEIPGVTTVKCADISENDNIHPPTKWRLAARIAEVL